MKCAFCIYRYRGEQAALVEHVRDLEVDGLADERLADALNAELRGFLQQRGLQQFIPLKRPSFEEEADGSLSIYYYHNEPMHDIVYQHYPKLVMMPNTLIESQLNELYDAHGLEGWHDERIRARGAED